VKHPDCEPCGSCDWCMARAGMYAALAVLVKVLDGARGMEHLEGVFAQAKVALEQDRRLRPGDDDVRAAR
jgi:hypothetical protein